MTVMKCQRRWTIAPENTGVGIDDFSKGGSPMPEGCPALGRKNTA
jgi:hypothetical protein